MRVFLGIPYAAPPVGPLRWKPPRPVAKWSGVRPAKPECVAVIYAAGRQNQVPLLAGWNRDEQIAPPDTTVQSYTSYVSERFKDLAPQVLRLYPAANDAEALRSAGDLRTDTWEPVYSTRLWIHVQVKSGRQPVYRYRFDVAPPDGPFHPGGRAAYHSGEIPYVFGNLDLVKGFAWRAEDYRVSEQMQKYWTNFARDGNPNGDGLVNWPPYGSASGWQVMYFAPQIGAEPDQTRDREAALLEHAAD